LETISSGTIFSRTFFLNYFFGNYFFGNYFLGTISKGTVSSRTNTLAFFVTELITAVKSYMIQASGKNKGFTRYD